MGAFGPHYFEEIMKYTHIVWDFNGTIFDDLLPSIESTNEMLEKRGIPAFDNVEAYRRVFGFPVKNYYERIGFDFSVTPYEELAVEWVALYLEKTKNAGLMPGVARALEKFQKMGITQVVISACESEMLNEQLRGLGVISYFDEIIGLDDIHAGGKGALVKKWREEHFDAKVMFIGDTVHDAEVASIAKSDCYLYLGGHQDKERLEKCGVVFEDFSELDEYI